MEITRLPISVVIVNYNAGTKLVDCVNSVIQEAERVIVVDNASTDDSLVGLVRNISDQTRLRIIRNTENLGFAKACNIGIHVEYQKNILFLNPDTVVSPGGLARMMNCLDQNPKAGMVGGMLMNEDGSEQAGGRRAVPTPWRTMTRLLRLSVMAKRYPRLFSDFLLHKEPVPSRPVDVEAISGACMLVRREVLDDVGGMDDSYFMHCEDLDLCMRFREQGWRVMFVPDAKILHYKGTCSRSRPIFVEWHKHKGMVRFYKKYFLKQYPWPLTLLVFSAVWVRFSFMAGRILVSRYIFRRASDTHSLQMPHSTASPDMAVVPKTQLPTTSTSIEKFKWKGRSVLVTGGSGFIGRHLVASLVAAGAQVKILTRPPRETSRIVRRQTDKVEHWYGDLTEPGSLMGMCDGVDTVFHLAGYAHVDDNTTRLELSPHWLITVEGTRTLLECACAADVKRLVFVSTVKAMGESSEQCLDETSPAAPEDNYGKSKLEAERLVLSTGRHCKIHTAVLRLPMVYGRDNAGNLPRMISAIEQGRFPPLPDVKNRRSMVHVDDVVQAMLLVAEQQNANGEIYLVTDDHVYSTRSIYNSICIAIGRQPPAWHVPEWLLWAAGRAGDILRAFHLPAPLTTTALRKLLGSAWYSCEKAKRELGYRPRHQLDDALADMISGSHTPRPGLQRP